jgi:ferritin-like metal-binding protein YciE
MTQRDLLITWLNDAYGMEVGIAEVLERHAASAADHPHIQAGLQQHLEQTRQHAELVKGCVERLGGETSGVKSGIASLGGAMQGMMAKLASDELIKNALQDYGTEHFEIACYTSLRTAATAIGDQETAQVAERILQDEMRMAEQLLKLIPSITNEMMVTQTEAASAR